MSSSSSISSGDEDEWTHESEEPEEALLTFKFLFSGDAGVGKSSLIFRLSDDGGYSDTVLPTVGVDIIQTERWDRGSNQQIVAHLWDTSGQQNLRLMSDSYYRGTHCLVFVYDCSVRDSFENIRRLWLPEATQNSTKMNQGWLKVLVANKTDKQCDVSEEEAAAFARKHAMMFFQTSAKAAHQHIVECFSRITHKLLEGFHPTLRNINVTMHRPVPALDRSKKPAVAAKRAAPPPVSRRTKPPRAAPPVPRRRIAGSSGKPATATPPMVRRATKPDHLRRSGPPVSRASKPSKK